MAVVVSVWILLACCIWGGFRVAREALRSARFSWESVVAGIALTGLGVVALYLRLRVLPLHHIMYVDEPWYEEAARNILRKGAPVLCEQGASGETCHPYPKSAGWPALLAISFALRGVSEETALRTSALLGALAVPAMASLTRLAGGRWYQALLAAALLTFHPVHLIWSMSAETNVASVTFLLWGLSGVLAFLASGTRSAALLAAGGLGVAAAVRPELWVAFIPALAVAGTRRAESIRWRRIGFMAGGASLGAFPGILSRDEFLVHHDGPVIQASYVLANLREWLGSAGQGGSLTVALLGLAALGTVVSIVRGRVPAAVLLMSTTLLIGLFVLSYYPPPGFSARTMLGAMAPAAVLAALALPGRPGPVSWAAAIVALALSGATARYSWQLRDALLRVPVTQRFETALPAAANQVVLPPDALVLAEWPTILTSTTGLKVMRIDKALAGGLEALGQEVGKRPIYLFCDMFCEKHFGGTDAPSGCRQIADRFSAEQLVSVGMPERNYGLFRLTGLAAPGERHMPCP